MHKFIHTKIAIIITIAILLSPILFSAVTHADSSTISTPYIPGTNEYELDGDTTFEVHVAEINALEITLSSNDYNAATHQLMLDLVPSSNAPVFNNTSLDITVGTSNITGYSLSMNTVYNNTATTSLTRTESINNTLPTIDTITSAISPNTFVSDDGIVNKWGYKLTNTNLDIDKTVYNPIITTSMPLDHTTGYAVNTTTIDFGAKVDDTMPAGSYAVELNFTAVTNVVPYIQNILSTECTTTPSTYYDIRDNQPYTIQRLNDGRCWMMDNLNLGADIVRYNLDSTNTNLANGTSISASSFKSWRMVNEIAPSYTEPLYAPVSSLNSSNGLAEDTYGSKYNTLYNFCAATAGTICSNASTSNASYDLCPAGWRLPTGGVSGEIQNLISTYNIPSNASGISDLQTILKFPLAGQLEAAPSLQGVRGAYWSSSAYTDNNVTTNMWILYFGDSDGTPFLSPAYSGFRSVGMSIRCVLAPTVSDMIYMQDFATLTTDQKNNVKLSMTEGQNYDIVDNRTTDQVSPITYKMANFNGSIWMTRNLRIYGNIPSAGSNFTNIASWNVNASTGSFASSVRTAPLSHIPTASELAEIGNTTAGAQATAEDVGIWYNSCATSAGNVCSSTGVPESGLGDICPAGWKLPTYDYARAINKYFTSDVFDPYVYTGILISFGGTNSSWDGKLSGVGILAQWWLDDYYYDDATNTERRRYLYQNNNGNTFYISSTLYMYGSTIRCVVK